MLILRRETGNQVTTVPSTEYQLRLTDRLATVIVYLILRCLRMTWRFVRVDEDNLFAGCKASVAGSCIVVSWHENILGILTSLRRERLAPLASLSRDGGLIAAVIQMLGFRTVRGSSSRGGPEARDELVSVTREGFWPTITPDGPRGPRRVLKSGVIDVARRSGVAVVPFAPVASRSWVLVRSWDQFRIPKPFAKIHVVFGAPVFVPPETHGAAFAAVKRQLQKSLDDVQTRAEHLSLPGRVP